MKKIVNAVYVVLFLLIIAGLMLTMNTEKNVASELDNRMLTEFPSFGDENYISTLEAYIKDRIGGRNIMLSAYSKMNDAVVEELDHPSYCNGQEGYVFFKMHSNVKYGDFHKTFAEMAKKLQDYCNERGTDFYLIFDPEKISVYRRYLPKGFYYNDDWVDEFCAYLDELGVKYVNNSKMLIQKSFTEQVYNWKYDAGHWNDLGCFYATAALYDLIRQDHPEVPELTKDLFNISTKIEEKLYNSEIVVNDEVPVFALKTSWTDVTSKWAGEVSVNSSFTHFHHYINNAEGAENLPKTLVFQGSYYNRGPQFLVSATSEYIGVHNYQNILDIDYYYNIFQPDMVIFDVAEYVFSDAYFNSAKMKVLDYNPGLFATSDDNTAKINELLSKATNKGEANVSIKRGQAVNKYVVNVGGISGAKYAYLINNGKVIDLDIGNSKMTGFASTDFLTTGDSPIVYIILENGNAIYLGSSVSESAGGDGSYEFARKSEEEVTVEDGVITFETHFVNDEGTSNRFDQFQLQLLDGEGTYINTFFAKNNTGKASETFCLDSFGLSEGWYYIRLKGNTNLRDPYADIKMYLKAGVDYEFELKVESINENKIVVSGFTFSE